jgi:hypothetical protein
LTTGIAALQLWYNIEKVIVVEIVPVTIAKDLGLSFFSILQKLAFCCQRCWQQGQH